MTRILLVVLLAFFTVPGVGRSQEPVSFSPDITIELDTTTVAGDEVVEDDRAGTLTKANLGTLAEPADVNAYHRFADEDQLFSLETGTQLAGGLVVTAADVIRFDGSNPTLEFDASAETVPDGAVVDAVSVHSSGDLLLSFDIVVELGVDPDQIVAFPADLVRRTAASTFEVFFDGSAQGVPAGLNLDAADYRTRDGHFLLSFDSNGQVGGVDFADHDILEFDPLGPSWSKYFDGTDAYAGLEAADLVAVVVAAPEPRALAQFGVALVALAWLRRRRNWPETLRNKRRIQ